MKSKLFFFLQIGTNYDSVNLLDKYTITIAHIRILIWFRGEIVYNAVTFLLVLHAGMHDKLEMEGVPLILLTRSPENSLLIWPRTQIHVIIITKGERITYGEGNFLSENMLLLGFCCC